MKVFLIFAIVALMTGFPLAGMGQAQQNRQDTEVQSERVKKPNKKFNKLKRSGIPTSDGQLGAMRILDLNPTQAFFGEFEAKEKETIETAELKHLLMNQKIALENAYATLLMDGLNVLQCHTHVLEEDPGLLKVVQAIDASTENIGANPPPKLSEGSIFEFFKNNVLSVISDSLTRNK